MQIALDDLAGYVAPERVVLCEGGTAAGGSDFDASCYNIIFSAEHPDVLFMGAGSADDVQNDPRKVGDLLRALAPNAILVRLIDRDDRRDDEVAELARRSVRVLSLRNIEAYLLHDEVLKAVCHSLGDGSKITDLLAEKQKALQSSVDAGGPPDDLKRAAGDIYNAAKRLFPGIRLGAEKRAFMTGVCAPQIKPGMAIYDQLRRDVF